MKRSLLIALALFLVSANSETNGRPDIFQLVQSGNVSLVAQALTLDREQVHARDEQGNTPLHAVADFKQTSFCTFGKIFCSRYRGDIPFGDRPRMAKVLIFFGADVNAENSSGETPLHLAAGLNNFNVSKALMDNGADIDARTDDGQTPLHRSAMFGDDISTAEMLIERGAEINAEDALGFTPLHYAMLYIGYRGEIKKIALLIENGADASKRTKGLVVPRYWAGSGDLFARYMQDSCFTPLHLAAFGNRVEAAGFLIAHGADPNAETSHGFTALSIAREFKYDGLAEFLIEKGARQ